jgi:hypothetical protein
VRSHGLYRVVGKRAYRGHEPGTEFWAVLDVNAERRALDRGDVVLLDRLIPRVEQGSFVFPDDWLRDANPSVHRDPRKRVSLVEGGR